MTTSNIQKAIEYVRSFEADGKLTYLWADGDELLVANLSYDTYVIIDAYLDTMFQVNLRSMSAV